MDLLVAAAVPKVLLNELRGKKKGSSNESFRIVNVSSVLISVQPTWKATKNASSLGVRPPQGKARFYVKHEEAILFSVSVDYAIDDHDPPPLLLRPGESLLHVSLEQTLCSLPRFLLTAGCALVAELDLAPQVWSTADVYLVLTPYEHGYAVEAEQRSFPDEGVPVRSKGTGVIRSTKTRAKPAAEHAISSSGGDDDDSDSCRPAVSASNGKKRRRSQSKKAERTAVRGDSPSSGVSSGSAASDASFGSSDGTSSRSGAKPCPAALSPAVPISSSALMDSPFLVLQDDDPFDVTRLEPPPPPAFAMMLSAPPSPDFSLSSSSHI
jgi:hypothetical protein